MDPSFSFLFEVLPPPPPPPPSPSSLLLFLPPLLLLFLPLAVPRLPLFLLHIVLVLVYLAFLRRLAPLPSSDTSPTLPPPSTSPTFRQKSGRGLLKASIGLLKARIRGVFFSVPLSAQVEVPCSPLTLALQIVSESSHDTAWNPGKCRLLSEVFLTVGTRLSVLRLLLDTITKQAPNQMTKIEGLSGCYYALKELVRFLRQGRQFIDDCTCKRASAKVFTKFEGSKTIDCLVSDLDNCVQVLVDKVQDLIDKNPKLQSFHSEFNYSLCLSDVYLGHNLRRAVENDRSHALSKLEQNTKSNWWDFMKLSAGEESALSRQLIVRLKHDYVGDIDFLKNVIYVSPRYVTLGKNCGHGSYGLVQEVLCFGESYAMKTISNERNIENVMEAAVHARLQHPHIVKLIWCTNNVELKNDVSLVMELLNMDLKTLIEQQFCNEKKGALLNCPLIAVDTMLQIAKAMQYLHSEGIMHRDLKSANVLVDLSSCSDAFKEGYSYIHVKLADFGLAKAKQGSINTAKVGTGYWRAPEVLWPETSAEESDARYSFPADVYSFSMTCYEILTGKEPFGDSPKDGLREKIATMNERPVLPRDVHPGLIELIQQCWDGRPQVRPPFLIICQELEKVKEDLLFGSSQRDWEDLLFGSSQRDCPS